MQFDRMVPDDQRLPSDPALSAKNENAKTDAIEGLLLGAAPNAIADNRGRQDRKLENVERVAVAKLVAIKGLGGGRYWGREFKIQQQKGDRPKLNLKDDLLGDVDEADCQVWYLPEMLTGAHNLIWKGQQRQYIVGKVIDRDEGGRRIIVVDSEPDYRFGIIQCFGPNGEPDFFDNRYWVALGEITNTQYDPWDAAIQVATHAGEDDPNYPQDCVVPITHWAEDNCKTHNLRPGTRVIVQWARDAGNPAKIKYWVESGDFGICRSGPCPASSTSTSDSSRSKGSGSCNCDNPVVDVIPEFVGNGYQFTVQYCDCTEKRYFLPCCFSSYSASTTSTSSTSDSSSNSASSTSGSSSDSPCVTCGDYKFNPNCTVNVQWNFPAHAFDEADPTSPSSETNRYNALRTGNVTFGFYQFSGDEIDSTVTWGKAYSSAGYDHVLDIKFNCITNKWSWRPSGPGDGVWLSNGWPGSDDQAGIPGDDKGASGTFPADWFFGAPAGFSPSGTITITVSNNNC